MRLTTVWEWPKMSLEALTGVAVLSVDPPSRCMLLVVLKK